MISGKNVVDDGGYGNGAGLGNCCAGGLYSYPWNTEKWLWLSAIDVFDALDDFRCDTSAVIQLQLINKQSTNISRHMIDLHLCHFNFSFFFSSNWNGTASKSKVHTRLLTVNCSRSLYIENWPVAMIAMRFLYIHILVWWPNSYQSGCFDFLSSTEIHQNCSRFR